MVDLGASESKFTWHINNIRVRTISKRLDRAVVDCLWRTSFPNVFVENLCRLHSDHHSILLMCGGILAPRGIRPFHFEAA